MNYVVRAELLMPEAKAAEPTKPTKPRARRGGDARRKVERRIAFFERVVAAKREHRRLYPGDPMNSPRIRLPLAKAEAQLGRLRETLDYLTQIHAG